MKNKMHPTMQRLFEATKLQPTELARSLNTSPQTITNWSNRGISKQGTILASKILGVNPIYILEGTGSPIIKREKLENVEQDIYLHPDEQKNVKRIDIGMRMIEERGRLGYSQQEFANYMQMDLNLLRAYEFGKQAIPAEFIAAIALNGVDIQYILTGIKNQ